VALKDDAITAGVLLVAGYIAYRYVAGKTTAALSPSSPQNQATGQAFAQVAGIPSTLSANNPLRQAYTKYGAIWSAANSVIPFGGIVNDILKWGATLQRPSVYT